MNSLDLNKSPLISQRAIATPASPIRRLVPYARKAKAAGHNVYHLNIGQPDIQSPREFWQAFSQYSDPILAYEESDGNFGLRKAWCEYNKRNLNINISPEQLLVTTGASEALVFLFMVCCDPGDEIIVFDPTYANYMGFAAISGVKLQPVATQIESGFVMPEMSEIQSKITSRTKAILVCNPNNPTGTVYSTESLQKLLKLCKESSLFLIADETYREFVYDGRKPFSVLELPDANDTVVVVDSLSKRFSLCGARLGCLITRHQDILAKCLNMAQARLASPTVEQHAAAKMLHNLSSEYVENSRREFESRCNLVAEYLSKMEGVKFVAPQGAFYCIAKLPLTNAEDFAKFMLEDFSYKGSTTFVAPANGFYLDNNRGLDEVRIACMLQRDTLGGAMDVLKRGLDCYLNKNE